jgi:hypothetical protein
MVPEADSIIIVSAPREGALLCGGTCTLGEHCEQVTVIVSHTFSSQSLGLDIPQGLTFGRPFNN